MITLDETKIRRSPWGRKIMTNPSLTAGGMVEYRVEANQPGDFKVSEWHLPHAGKGAEWILDNVTYYQNFDQVWAYLGRSHYAK